MKHTTTGTCLKGSEDPVVNLRETLWVALLFITFLKYRFYTAYADIITLESLLVYFCFLVVSRKSRYSVLELRAWTWIDNSSKFLWVKRDCGLAASKSYSFLTYYFFLLWCYFILYQNLLYHTESFCSVLEVTFIQLLVLSYAMYLTLFDLNPFSVNKWMRWNFSLFGQLFTFGEKAIRRL